MKHWNTIKNDFLKTYCAIAISLLGITEAKEVIAADKMNEGSTCSFNLKLSKDTAICMGSTLILSAGGADSYSWSTGETTASIMVDPTHLTEYWVMASKGNCVDFETVKVDVLPTPGAMIDGITAICNGDSVELTASGGDAYLWNTGSTNPSIKVAPTASTLYHVIVSNKFCYDTAEVNVKVKPRLPLIRGNKTTCIGDQELLYTIPEIEGINSYLWNVPEGWNIIKGQGTATISVKPGTIPGKGEISVVGDEDQCFISTFPVVSSMCIDNVLHKTK